MIPKQRIPKPFSTAYSIPGLGRLAMNMGIRKLPSPRRAQLDTEERASPEPIQRTDEEKQLMRQIRKSRKLKVMTMTKEQIREAIEDLEKGKRELEQELAEAKEKDAA